MELKSFVAFVLPSLWETCLSFSLPFSFAFCLYFYLIAC